MGGFDFEQPVAPGGYAWWYVDAFSDDGRHALTVIVFVGSVFSPWYAAARRRGTADPSNHCAFNVALGGPHARWSMTERHRAALERDANSIRIGPSRVERSTTRLTLQLDERCAPLPRPIRGRVTIEAVLQSSEEYPLDAAGAHLWRPLWPRARVSVVLEHPNVNWQGDGYVDSNVGERPLEDSFRSWNWCRVDARCEAGPQSTIVYDIEQCDDSRRELALRFDALGAHRLETAGWQQHELPRTRWGLARSTRAAPGTEPQLVGTLEDGPFYARSELRLAGELTGGRAMHEALSLERFRRRSVQSLLPFRMPRSRRR